MGSSRRVCAVALLTLAVAVAPLAPCDCAEMVSQRPSDSHCGSSQPTAPVLASGCSCVCMTAGPETVAFFMVGKESSPLQAAAHVAAPLGLFQPATPPPGPAIREHSPARLVSSVLRI